MTSEWNSFERARRGDEIAWREVVGRHQPRLLALALFVTRSASAAEDVVQETFARALRGRIEHRSGSVSGYLGTIAYRLAVKEARRRSRQVELVATEPPDAGTSPLEDLLSAERDRRVAAAIHALDEGHRDVLILRFYGGHSYEETAALLDLPLGTVKSRIFYAVQACRKRLRAEGWME